MYLYDQKIGAPLTVALERPEPESFTKALESLTVGVSGYYKKGDKIKNFTFEDNDFITDTQSFFERYGLFINENGFNVVGKERSVVWDYRVENLCECETPIFVGDYIIVQKVPYYVSQVRSYYDFQYKTYYHELLLSSQFSGVIKKKSPNNPFFETLIKSFEDLANAVDTYILGFSAKDPQSGTLVPISNVSDFGAFGKAVEQIKKELENVRF